MQIKMLQMSFDVDKLINIYDLIESGSKQICFTDRPGIHSLEDGTGSLFEYHPCSEMDWSELNPSLKGTYMQTVYDKISEHYNIGRSRFMVMNSGNRALSYHYDDGLRLHIPLKTNPHAWFINDEEELVRMNKLGNLYSLDATRYHSALNLSREDEPRLHIVFSAEKK